MSLETLLLLLLLLVLAVATASCLYVPARLLWGVRRLRTRIGTVSEAVGGGEAPGVLVVLPCKASPEELDELEANLAPVLEQDHPDYRVVFTIGSPDDPARTVIDRLVARFPGRAELVVAEPRPGCSRKISNQLGALAGARPTDRIYVFLDADARPCKSLLRRLVAPLEDPGVGVATGFRWYRPRPGAPLASWLRAAWNAAGLGILTDPQYAYAWGGAMAIRREVFERGKVGEFWAHAATDDMSLTSAIKEAGLRVHFVPEALVESPEDLNLAQVIEWTNRQTVICRVYHPRMWRDVFIGEALTLLVTLAWLGLLVAGLAVIVLGRVAYELGIVRVVQGIRPELVDRKLKWRLALFAPLTTPLLVLNSLRSWISTSIRWRGVRYRLLGPRRIEEIDPAPTAQG